MSIKPYVTRNAPGRDGDGGTVVIPFVTDAEMAAILAAIARPSPAGEPVAWASTDPMFNRYGVGAIQDRRDDEAGFTNPLYTQPPAPVVTE